MAVARVQRMLTCPFRSIVGVLVCAMLLAVTPGAANAYTIKNTLARGCHEEITSAALRAVRGELPTAAPLPASDDDQALIADLQFVPDPDMMDLAGATLLAAVRDNDLKGRGSEDLSQLAAVHGNPDGQQEHCLRSEAEDEPTGTQSAVADCVAFIRGKILEALAGLDAAGNPDPTNRTILTIHLSRRGQVDASLPTYYVKMGQAIHAIEDSFTHTFRTPDETQITVALNWIDKVNGTLVESRDGPPHVSELDRCDDPDSLRTTRRALAIAAASGVLRSTLDPQMTPDQKMAAVDAVLKQYVSYSPGCTFDNNWCDAPERQYGDTSACGCHVGRADAGGGAMIAGGVALVFAVGRRRRRRRLAAVTAALTVLGAMLLAPGSARAQETTSTTTTVPATTPGTPPTVETTVKTPTTTTTAVTAPRVADANAPPPPKIIPVAEPGPRNPNKPALGAALMASGSVDNPALAGSLGARLRLTRHWSFGLDGEWNPWLAINGTFFRAGVVNIFGSAMLRFPLAYENFNLRTTVSLGASYLISNLYGAPSGSIGPYAGVSVLGLEWKLSRAFFLIINPLNFAMPIPQIKGVPLLYPQYRLSLGFEVYLG